MDIKIVDEFSYHGNIPTLIGRECTQYLAECGIQYIPCTAFMKIVYALMTSGF